MKVKELIEMLKEMPQDKDVDVEGETYYKGEVINVTYWEKYNKVTLDVNQN